MVFRENDPTRHVILHQKGRISFRTIFSGKRLLICNLSNGVDVGGCLQLSHKGCYAMQQWHPLLIFITPQIVNISCYESCAEHSDSYLLRLNVNGDIDCYSC